jgi:hypothetical protein
MVQCMSFVYSKTSVTVNPNPDDSSHTSCKEILDKLIEFVSTVEVNQLELVSYSLSHHFKY